LEERCAGDDENSWKLFELWHPEGAKAEPGCEWTLKSIAAAVEDEGQLFSIVGCPNSESDPDGPHTWRVIISPEYARRANGWWQVTEPETRHLPTRTKLLTFCHTSMRIFGTRTSDPSVVCEWIRALEEIAGSTVAKAVDSVPRPRHRGPVEAGST
jgi:hypothetical protein